MIEARILLRPVEVEAEDFRRLLQGGRNDELDRGAIRFSFGRFNTAEEVDQVLEVLPAAVQNLRRLAPTAKKTS